MEAASEEEATAEVALRATAEEVALKEEVWEMLAEVTLLEIGNQEVEEDWEPPWDNEKLKEVKSRLSQTFQL